MVRSGSCEKNVKVNMDDKVRLLESVLGETRIKRGIDISEHLQTGLGAKVRAFYIATTTRELIKAIELCRELRINFLLIGSGSKMAISEQGVDGLVIKNRSDNARIFGVKGKVSRNGIGVEEAMVEVDSGISLSGLAGFAQKQGLGGLEELEKAVGTVGGSLAVNQILREKAIQVKALTLSGHEQTKELKDVKREDVILSAVFKLKAKRAGT